MRGAWRSTTAALTVVLLVLAGCAAGGTPAATSPTAPAIGNPPPAAERATPLSQAATNNRSSAPLPATTAAAEAEGRDYPQSHPPQEPDGAFQRAAGTAARDCVEVEPLLASDADSTLPASDQRGSAGHGIRSGEFVAGPFGGYKQNWARDPRDGKLWWVPLHRDAMPGLTVRAVLLDDPAIGRAFTLTPAAGADGPFYPSGVVLPAPGRWLLLATAGPNWGCFVMTLRS